MSDELDFSDLTPISVSAVIPLFDEHGTKTGVKKCTMHEATGGAAIIYRNACMDCTVRDAEGNITSVKSLASVEPLLVSLLLVDDATGKPVSQQFIEALPARIQKALFEKAKRISGIGELSAERKAFDQALALEGAPVSMTVLREYVKKLNGVTYRALKAWLAPDNEELAKNGQSGMPVGSN